MKSDSKLKNNKKGSTCLNCEQTISPNDNFCPNCGQINNTSRISLKYYFIEYLSGFFSFDNRFFKTIFPLIFKPGKVTREFIEGKRVRYVNPFQLYLNITILFFLIIGFFSTIDNFKGSEKTDDVYQEEAKVLVNTLDSIKTIIIHENKKKDSLDPAGNNFPIDLSSDSINLNNSNQKDSINNSFEKTIEKIGVFMDYDEKQPNINISTALNDLGYKVTPWNIFYYSKAHNINKFINDPEFRSSYSDNLVSKISIALFFLLPVFTLFVALLYIKNKYNYSEHLVFVFHSQTVFFILLIFFIFFDRIFKTEIGTSLAILLFLIYLFIALRNFYRQGIFITFIKFIILNSFYVFLATIGGILVSFIAFLI